jgi:UDP:flavonoid glycosyltransferase YjiC (YdhE family)
LAFAGSPKPWPTRCPHISIAGIGPEAFAVALRQGKPVLTAATLRSMVEADLALLRAHKPDVVIGDFRLSLSISARLASVPYATVTNAYWSPTCTLRLPMPVLPLSRHLPLWLASALFELGKPFALPMHCLPMNRVRQEYGLPSLGNSIRAVYTDADHVLFADIAGMFPSQKGPNSEHYLGPILWAPQVDTTSWSFEKSQSSPIVYISVGSSGDPLVLRALVKAAIDLPVTVVASTAGSRVLDDMSCPNLISAPYLPGDRVAAIASLVVCNGGSMGCQQAMAYGVPVLGVVGNMDQFLNMAGIEAAGVGLSIRADRLTSDGVRQFISRLISEPGFRESARSMAGKMRRYEPSQHLYDLLPTFSNVTII